MASNLRAMASNLRGHIDDVVTLEQWDRHHENHDHYVIVSRICF